MSIIRLDRKGISGTTVLSLFDLFVSLLDFSEEEKSFITLTAGDSVKKLFLTL